MTDIPLQQIAKLAEALQGVLRELAEPEAVLRAVLAQAVRSTGADRGLLVEVEGSGRIEYRVLLGYRPKSLEGDLEGFSRSLFTRVLETRREVLLDSAMEDPYFSRRVSVEALRTASILCMPVFSGDDVVAIVHLENRRPCAFRAEHRELLRGLLGIAGPLLDAMRSGRSALEERDRLRLSERSLRQEAEASRKQLAEDWSFGRFVGRSETVRELEEEVRRAAQSEFPVLLVGETGTGKGILARVLHYTGARSERPFVTVFCPSLEKGMVESELFGHKRGAFTGAQIDRIGKVQAAEGGTLFLDEVGDLPLEIQPKLLRLLQEKRYERIGDPKECAADVRVVAATHRDLEIEVEEGRFRADLFQRLNFLPIRVPPLRERPQDIPGLLRHCLDQTPTGRYVEVSPEAARMLEEHDYAWPGNVRQIEQIAARLTVRGSRNVTPAVLEELLTEPRKRSEAPRAASPTDFDAGLPVLLSEAEKGWLEEALRLYPRLTRAELAAKLRISPASLYNKLREYGLNE